MKPASISALHDGWPALSGLLDEALALPPTQRDVWLAGLAGASAEHRDSLRALLATQAEIETGDFLADLPPLPPEPPPNAGAAPGAIVGPYRLISQIGQGGMASVWLAERADGLIRRQVALKLPAVAWGEAFATRLAREREILASLTHEHIARLYDAGVDAQGRPFFAMEFIDGAPIDAFCRERQLPLADRIDLLLQVMAAVTHAHARLVVHRDLKPSNILVSAAAKVSLLDFGIAKLLEGELTEETALTRAAGHALTPDYASPEQICGEPLGTASDIYSLAVVAYELLAGDRPYRLKRASASELAQAIAEARAPLASETAGDKTLKRQLRGDLDAILNKALKKRPDERYLTMDAFAQDLRRWRDGEPVQARPDGLGYRTRKFVGRYRLQVAAGAVTAMAMVGGTTAALWQAHRAQTEATTAQAVQTFIESVFMANSADQADPLKAAETPARELLDRGAERIDAELRGEPLVRLRLYRTLAEMYDHVGLPSKAAELSRRRLALARELDGAGSVEAAFAAIALADALVELYEQKEALALLDGARTALDAAGRAGQPAQLPLEISFANLYWGLDPGKALAAAERAVALARHAAPSRDLVSALQLVGESAVRLGRPQQAVDALGEAAALVEARPELGQRALPQLYSTLADAQSRLGERARAELTFAKALKVAREGVVAPGPLHISAFKLANAQTGNGHFREAIETLGPTATWVRSHGAVSEVGQAAASMLGALGRAQASYGLAEQGLATIDEALALLAAASAPAPEHLGPLLALRAEALIDLGRFDEARAAVDRSLALIGDDKTRQARYPRSAQRRLWVATGDAPRAWHDIEAEPAPTADATDPTAGARRDAERAWIAEAAHQHDTARALASQALARIASLPSRDFLQVAEAQASLALGEALLGAARPADALPPIERAVALRRAMFDPEHSPLLADAVRALAEARRAVGDNAAAERQAPSPR